MPLRRRPDPRRPTTTREIPKNQTLKHLACAGMGAASDVAYLGNSGPDLFLVSYFGSPDALDRLSTVQLDALDTGDTKLQVSASTLNTEYFYLAGNPGPGDTWVVQKGNSVADVGGTLFIGFKADSSGVYNLVEHATLITALTVVGNDGTGEFIQDGGTNNTNRTEIALEVGTSGRYDLIAGTLTLGGVVSISSDGLVNDGQLALSFGNISITLQGGALDIVWWSDNRGQGGDVYDLCDRNRTLTGTFGRVSLPALGNGLSWQTASLYTTGEISITAVPEPASDALLLAGLGLVGAAVRRRKVA